jgi:hypothetical protein
MMLPLKLIRRDGGTQPRVAMDLETVERYARDLREGVAFAPVEVVYDGTNYWCWDGFHRCAAAANAGRSEIDVEVKQGTLADAQWLSLSANKQHGLARSNEDKRNAVIRALEHDHCQGLSDLQIALHIGVSQPFVGRVRKSLATYNGSKSKVRTCRDGRVMDTSKIGNHATTHRHPRSRSKEDKNAPKAFQPKLGHSAPCPMIPLQFSPNNPQTAAATIVREFSSEFVQTLIAELTHLLSEQGAAA